MAFSNENNPTVIMIPLGSPSANDDLPGFYARKKFQVQKVYLTDAAGLSDDGSNYVDVKLKDGSDNAIASYSQNGQAITANEYHELSVDSDYAELDGESAWVDVDVTGTGALDNAMLQVEGYYV